jgi:thioredoxin:protein disulfide reductase
MRLALTVVLLMMSMPAAPAAADVTAPIGWRGEKEGVAAARKLARPTLIYFSADWCMPCREMERVTLADARVVRALERFVPVRVDCTDPDATDAGAIMKRYKVEALPHLILLDGKGRLQRRIDRFISADELAAILEKVR